MEFEVSYEGQNAHIAFMQIAKALEHSLMQEAQQMMLEAKQQEEEAKRLAAQSTPVPQIDFKRNGQHTR